MAKSPSYWLIVVSSVEALEWLESSETMAFRDHIPAGRISRGDRFVIYGTRGAGHNPGRDTAQVLATGTFASDMSDRVMTVLDEQYTQSFRLAFDAKPLTYRSGAAFAPLLPDLPFVVKKKTWFAYVRKSLVPISNADFAVLAAAVKAARKRNGPICAQQDRSKATTRT